MADAYVPVPHVERDLVPLGLAQPIPRVSPKAYKITPRGQQMIRDAIDHNAQLPDRPPVYIRKEDKR